MSRGVKNKCSELERAFKENSAPPHMQWPTLEMVYGLREVYGKLDVVRDMHQDKWNGTQIRVSVGLDANSHRLHCHLNAK